MTIEISPSVEAQLRAKAKAEGLSPGAYIERLINAEDSRRTRLEAFH